MQSNKLFEKKTIQINKYKNQKSFKIIKDDNIINEINNMLEIYLNDNNKNKIMEVKKNIRLMIKQKKENARIQKLASKKRISEDEALRILEERKEKARIKRILKKQQQQQLNNNIQNQPVEIVEVIENKPIEEVKNEVVEIIEEIKPVVEEINQEEKEKIERLKNRFAELLEKQKLIDEQKELKRIHEIEKAKLEQEKEQKQQLEHQQKKEQFEKEQIEQNENIEKIKQVLIKNSHLFEQTEKTEEVEQIEEIKENVEVVEVKNEIVEVDIKKFPNIEEEFNIFFDETFYKNLNSFSKRKTFFKSEEINKFNSSFKFMVEDYIFFKYFFEKIKNYMDGCFLTYFNVKANAKKLNDIITIMKKYDMCIFKTERPYGLSYNDIIPPNHYNQHHILRFRNLKFYYIGSMDYYGNGYLPNEERTKAGDLISNYDIIKKLKFYNSIIKELLEYMNSYTEFKFNDDEPIKKNNDKKKIKKIDDVKPIIEEIKPKENIEIIEEIKPIEEKKTNTNLKFKYENGYICHYDENNNLIKKDKLFNDDIPNKKLVLIKENEKERFEEVNYNTYGVGVSVIDMDKIKNDEKIEQNFNNNDMFKQYDLIRDDFYILIEFLQKNLKYGSKQFNKINEFFKKYPLGDCIDKEFFKNFCMNTETNCFIYTEKKMINEMLKYVENNKDKNLKFLECTAGLGHILHYILKENPNTEITVYELNSSYVNILNALYPKQVYPNITIKQGDFLQQDIKEKYDLIFCNPPFTFRNNKRYYINFLFKCFEIMQYNLNNVMYFISPDLYTVKHENNKDGDFEKLNEFLTVERIKEIFNIELKKIEYKIFKDCNDDDYNDNIKILVNKINDILPSTFEILNKLNFSIKTNTNANLYRFEGFKNYEKNN
jgi:predicted RNA methylase